LLRGATSRSVRARRSYDEAERGIGGLTITGTRELGATFF
jgi:hypothetical protein